MNEHANKDQILGRAAGTAPSSEATAIEQSRAIAQVQAAFVVAQQRPRDQTQALTRMRETCAMKELAERAFFEFPRAGGKVMGPTIHLATELARVWGNIDYGIAELRRDDIKGESEMLAYCSDLETNMRNSLTFIVPHKRDKKGGAEVLTELRDIYENNTNMGARRLRTCILKALPPWLTEEAKSICFKTLEAGGGVALPTRIANCLALFAEIGVSREQIERKTGVPADKMTAVNLANLTVTYKSIRHNEITKSEAFEPVEAQAITDSLRGQKTGQAAGNGGATNEAPAPPGNSEPEGAYEPPAETATAPENGGQTAQGEKRLLMRPDRNWTSTHYREAKPAIEDLTRLLPQCGAEDTLPAAEFIDINRSVIEGLLNESGTAADQKAWDKLCAQAEAAAPETPPAKQAPVDPNAPLF